MIKFIVNRIFYGILVMYGVLLVVFALFQILPGDASRMLMGERTDISTTEAIRKDLGLDKPKYIQLAGYFNDMSILSLHNKSDEDNFFYLDDDKYAPYITLIKGTNRALVMKYPYMKRSYQTQRPVSEMIAQAFPKTFVIAIISMVFAVSFGIFLGITSAIYKNTFIDKSILVSSVFGMSLPSFFFAIIISYIFAYLLGDVTGLNMTGNLTEIDDFGNGERVVLKNMVLPVITLSIRPLAVLTELSRASMLDVLSTDYIVTAKAKGLPQKTILMRHALKNSLNPIITSSTGWLASLLAGTVFVELVFDWKGMGTLIVDALDKYDLPVLMGCIFFISVILIILNIISDILYAKIDPRVKLNE